MQNEMTQSKKYRKYRKLVNSLVYLNSDSDCNTLYRVYHLQFLHLILKYAPWTKFYLLFSMVWLIWYPFLFCSTSTSHLALVPGPGDIKRST